MILNWNGFTDKDDWFYKGFLRRWTTNLSNPGHYFIALSDRWGLKHLLAKQASSVFNSIFINEKETVAMCPIKWSEKSGEELCLNQNKINWRESELIVLLQDYDQKRLEMLGSSEKL